MSPSYPIDNPDPSIYDVPTEREIEQALMGEAAQKLDEKNAEIAELRERLRTESAINNTLAHAGQMIEDAHSREIAASRAEAYQEGIKDTRNGDNIFWSEKLAVLRGENARLRDALTQIVGLGKTTGYSLAMQQTAEAALGSEGREG